MDKPKWQELGWSSEAAWQASELADAIVESGNGDAQKEQRIFQLIELLNGLIENRDAKMIVEGLLLELLLPAPRGRPPNLEKRLRRASCIHHQVGELLRQGIVREEAICTVATHHEIDERSVTREIAWLRKVFPDTRR